MRANPTLTKVGTWTVSNASQPSVGSQTNSIQSFYLQMVASAGGDAYTLTQNSTTYVTSSAEL